MHPYLLESLAKARIAELQGAGARRSTGLRAERCGSVRRTAAGRVRVGQLLVRLGLSLIDDGLARRARRQPVSTAL
jgi:hypothetical protein